jgi:hypothetical protein
MFRYHNYNYGIITVTNARLFSLKLHDYDLPPFPTKDEFWTTQTITFDGAH